MKKRITLILLSAILLQSCDIGEKAPKCDDPQIVEMVLELFNDKVKELNENQKKINGIFTVASNDELRTCECEGTVPVLLQRIVPSPKGGVRPLRIHNPSINYKVQINEDGDISIRMNSERP